MGDRMASFNILGSAKRSGNLQTFLLFIYSAVVTVALVWVVCRNFEGSQNNDQNVMAEAALYDSGLTLDDSLVQADTTALTVDEGMNEAESFDNPSVEWSVESEETQPETKQDTLFVEKGDHFIGILQRIGMEYLEANQAAEALKEAGYDVRGLRVGQKLDITKTVEVPNGELLSVDKIVLEPSAGIKYIVTRNEDEKYVAEMEQLELQVENRSADGVIQAGSTLGNAMQNAGVPASVIGNFINIFTYTVDFGSDVKAGDSFKILFNRKVAPDGKVVKNGDILYAELNLGKDKLALYRFEDDGGSVDYYNEKGIVLKRALDKKPMEYRSARISSRFGWRLHPILKRRILHSGVDYAAPKGTRIYASADGVIKRAQWAGGYGKYVVIRHNSEFSTGYAHMNAFAKGIRPGVRVKQGQVIGYVGSTGRSTGPHLHFEVIKNGKKVDPLKVKAATGTNLAGKNLQRFKTEVAKIIALVEGQTDFANVDTQAVENAQAAVDTKKSLPKKVN